ncbi:GTPase, G3E family [Tistlia consotensis]|uniref:GTPase, G3E family n=1 Tax=Tistlia consotensis USBA 355 TaxID=560819 RepID=A0A1Y6BK41_9PROT|nr:GTP-binding protein [Tistlia consotensis]SMF07841.1 GTPase, G3E family [Tistlia consotensis USBA 355]SNR35685.1 GTPase, G3E family [Tistlia consotensis]
MGEPTEPTREDPTPGDALADRRDPLIPVTVLTGFLGSGKTTLLKALLARPELADTAVVVNEFGEVGLDHLLLEGSEEQIVELSSGCLCCTVRWDLVETLDSLWSRRAAGEIAFRRIVVETTGLADPAPILHSLISDPRLARRYRLDGVVTVVDAVAGAETLGRQPEAAKQAAVADRIVLSKTDLPEARPDEVEALLRRFNPSVPVERASHGAVEPGRILGLGLFDPARKHPDVAAWLNAEAFAEAQAHDQGHRHLHDVNRHDARIRAFCVERERPIASANFSLFLELLLANRGADLLRVKGLVDIAENPGRPAVLHGVQHLFHPVVFLDAWPGGSARTRLVFIVRDIPQAWIEKLLDALTGEQADDGADPLQEIAR